MGETGAMDVLLSHLLPLVDEAGAACGRCDNKVGAV